MSPDWVNRDDDALWVLRTPRSHYVKRGIVWLTAWPFLMGMVLMFVACATLEGLGEIGVLVASVPLGLSAGVGSTYGAIRLIRSRALSRASELQVDWSANEFRQGAQVTPFSAVKRLELCQHSKMLAWRHIVAHVQSESSDQGPYRAPTGDQVPLIRFMTYKEDDAAKALLRELGARLERPTQVAALSAPTGAASMFGKSAKTAAAAAYFPIQGIWLFASLGVLLLDKRPLSRFHAKQSLAVGAGWFVFVTGGVLAIAGASALVGGGEPPPWVLLPGVMLLLVGALAHLVLRIIGCFEAYNEQYWVFPGLGWLSRRWIPADPVAGGASSVAQDP
jgi:uncharacterized membrane protein